MATDDLAPDGPAVGEYRLWRQGGGRTAFAEVRVEVSGGRSAGTSQVVSAVDPADTTSAQPEQDAEAFEAAVTGATDMLAALTEMGVDVEGSVVQVVRLGLSVMDSTPDAVRAAAAAATAVAFGAADRFEVAFDTGWQCRPARQQDA